MNEKYPDAGAPRRRRRKKKKNLRIVLILLCVILLCLFIFSAYKVISTLYGYRQADNKYTELGNQYVTVVASPTPAPVEEKAEETEASDGIDPEVSPLRIDFEGLRSQSTDYVAWIYSPNTKINYPVAFTDNNFYYLDHIPGEIQNSNGTLFIDCSNASDFSDQNTCIYGHNMNDGSMFASLRDYRDPAYYTEHPVIYLSTPDFNYRLDLIGGFVTEPTSFAYVRNFQSDEQFMSNINLIRSLSTFQSDVEVGPEDKIVTLSTCTYERDDGRYVVVGKLVRIH